MVHNAQCINHAFSPRRYATFAIGIARRDGDPPHQLFLPSKGEPGRDPEFRLLSRGVRASAYVGRARADDGIFLFNQRGIRCFFTCPGPLLLILGTSRWGGSAAGMGTFA